MTPDAPSAVTKTPSPSQREAIEAPAGPVLVLAGPGAGKTFCLIERIRFLIERLRFQPARICAFTFTNKAADEIASRLEHQLGRSAADVRRGTIHAFCADLLREHGERVGLAPGFGIADEEYQRSVLRRLVVPAAWHGSILVRFAAHRFRGDPLLHDDAKRFAAYERFLARRNLLDFDMLVLKAAELLREAPDVAAALRARWDYVLVDEFQDLNRTQYAVIRALTCEHRNLFAVGDDEQSIYSWAGADPKVFTDLVNDFGLSAKIQLEDNRRCPRDAFAYARRLIALNEPIFHDRRDPRADRVSPFPVTALSFPDEDAEIAWVLDDLRRDREEHGLAWGDIALLYRKHEIGDAAEASCLTAGIPCRLAQGRAFSEDPVVAYVMAALRVIAAPDGVHHERFLEVVLPKTLFGAARAKAEERRETTLRELDRLSRELPWDHGDARKIRRGFYALRNLAALGRRHTSLPALVEELLSQRVGVYRTVLEEHHDELCDPAEHPDIVRMADRLRATIESGRTLWMPRQGGVEIAVQAMLREIGIQRIRLGGEPPAGAERLTTDDLPSLGIALGTFKAVQLLRSRQFSNAFVDYTAVDLETTDRDIATAEIVEVAAVRVRDGVPVDEYRQLIRPRVEIAAAATRVHGLTAADVADAPAFEDAFPAFRAFCGNDVLVAHNGYQFDFPILRRMIRALPDAERMTLCTYDTLPLARELHPGSAKLTDLARHHGIDHGRAHHALDDTRTLAQVFVKLGDEKVVRARKTSLVNLLDYLGVGLALTDESSLGEEGRLLRRLTRSYALGQYSDALDAYRRERARDEDPAIPTVEQLIEQLGGEELMRKVRAEKTAAQRYPQAMARLRRLLDLTTGATLADQITTFLERAVLSRWDGTEPDRDRVNLLTLHSTKGLEFSRVYVLGAEDAQLPGTSPAKANALGEVEEARRLLYVGMTRTMDRLVLTRVKARDGKPTGGHRFLDEMGLEPTSPARQSYQPV